MDRVVDMNWIGLGSNPASQPSLPHRFVFKIKQDRGVTYMDLSDRIKNEIKERKRSAIKGAVIATHTTRSI